MANLRNGYENVAFSRPGGGAAAARPRRPLDLAHLGDQTLGDRDLEREVLALFVEQAQSVRKRIGKADMKERLFLAHSLKGSARGVGAFPIAECLCAVEESPTDRQILRRLERLIDEASDFIASIDR